MGSFEYLGFAVVSSSASLTYSARISIAPEDPISPVGVCSGGTDARSAD